MSKLTRSSSKNTNSLTNSKAGTNIRKLRPRKSKIIIDSDDEYFELPSEILPQTPKKTSKYLNDDAVTPPKQKKIDVTQNEPHTKKLTNIDTPSTLLHRLNLSSPVQNKMTQNRKSLFQESTDKSEKDNTRNKERYSDNKLDSTEDLVVFGLGESEPEFEKTTNNSYRNARKALHSGVPNNLIGREKELDDLRNFIKGHIENCTSGSMYVSGPPGTGKTASLSIILQEKEVSITISSLAL